ncbi:hypothetical protein [Frankia sp. AvcI1]|uniref:hypothetical protein n=1 Tax=Frankia sp. AvcI1 TaxID=573496 RepID=UPI0006EBFB87|nr:hypothetical protein [Frankia sp. AvcI1]
MSREPDPGDVDLSDIDLSDIDLGDIDLGDGGDGDLGDGDGDGDANDRGPVDGAREAGRQRADARDASRLVSFGLRPRLVPARDPDYRDLVRRYLREAEFAALTQAIAAGLGLVVLDVSERAGLVPAGAEDSAFAVRIGDYARRAGGEHRAADRLLHALAQLAVAALAYPRPADLADASYVGRVSVHGVDAFVRETCRLLGERTADDDPSVDPPVDAPRLEAAWRLYARRTSTGTTRDARRLAGSTTGIIARAMNFLAESGCLVPVGDEAGGTYRTTPRYQVQVRELAADAAFEELLALGVVTVTDGAGSVRVLVDEPALLETTPAGEAADV